MSKDYFGVNRVLNSGYLDVKKYQITKSVEVRLYAVGCGKVPIKYLFAKVVN